MRANIQITIFELSIELEVSTLTIERDIEKLKEEKRIFRKGSLTDGNWEVLK